MTFKLPLVAILAVGVANSCFASNVYTYSLKGVKVGTGAVSGSLTIEIDDANYEHILQYDLKVTKIFPKNFHISSTNPHSSASLFNELSGQNEWYCCGMLFELFDRKYQFPLIQVTLQFDGDQETNLSNGASVVQFTQPNSVYPGPSTLCYTKDSNYCVGYIDLSAGYLQRTK